MDDDQLRRAMLGSEAAATEMTRRAREDETSREAEAQRAREAVEPRDLDLADRTDDELVGRTPQAGRRTRAWIFGTSIAFVAVLLAMTVYLVIDSGPDYVELIALFLLSLTLYGLVNAATYEGKDPLEPLREIDEEHARKDRERREARQRAREARRASKETGQDAAGTPDD
jgi:hypothetical protein